MARHRRRSSVRRLLTAGLAAALLSAAGVAFLPAGPDDAAAGRSGHGPGAARTGTARGALPGGTASTAPTPPGPSPVGTATTNPWLSPPKPYAVGHLRRGANPSALPGDLLIADKLNSRLIVVDPYGRVRWQFPRPGDLAPRQTFKIPDDAFFTPDGRYIIATQEDQSVISVIDIAQRRIVYRYGVPGHPGRTADHLSNPDDAMVLPNGEILTADIKNCRLLLIAPHTHAPLHVIGLTTNACRHAPPRHWGSPNGAFPMPDGHYLVTEINGDWVDAINLRGKVYWSTHPPGVAYPSDSNRIGPNRFLTVDYSTPGRVVIFTRNGRKIWSWSGPPRQPLDHPSLALGLPNGDIVLTDDYNDRVLVVDPHTNKIVWQYGVTGVAGRRHGHLDNPDGIDLVPPNSLLITHLEATRTHRRR